MTQVPTADDFRRHLGATFRADAGGPELTLVSVTDGSDTEARRAAGLQPGFIAVFRGPPEPILPEGMHSLRSGTGGEFHVHIMPIHTPMRDRQDYQVLFG